MNDIFPNFIVQSEMILRLIIVIIACGLIGLEREYKGESAGLRTHILIGLGSCIAMILSLSYVDLNPDSGIDSLRIAGSVMSGIGFLGAGAIMQVGLNTKGLTSAANIWVVAALGLLIGAGFYYISILVVGIILINLIIISKLENYFTYSFRVFQMKLELHNEAINIQELKKVLAKLCIKHDTLEYEEHKDNVEIKINGRIRKNNSLSEVNKKLKKQFKIKKISFVEN